MTPAALSRMLAPTLRRVALMVSRAVVELVDDTKRMQTLQASALADEVHDGVERFQNYGFTACPHPGAEGIAVSVGGTRDHLVVIAVDDRRYRLKALAEGEVAIYTDEGDRIVIRRGGTIQVVAATKLQIQAPAVEMSGTLSVAQSITAGSSITAGTTVTAPNVVGSTNVSAAGIALAGHKHGGVASGSGTTGAPQ